MTHPGNAGSAFVPDTLFVFICRNRNVFIWPSPVLYPPTLKKTRLFWCLRASQFLRLSLVAAFLAARRPSPCQCCLPACTQRCATVCIGLLTANNASGWGGSGWGFPQSQQSYRSWARSDDGPPDSITKNTNKQLNNTLAARRLPYIKI